MASLLADSPLASQEANRLEKATTERLLKAKKLSLIVDLDQTIVHAAVDPTIGKWLADPSNPNHAALRDVHKFRLGTNSDLAADDGCWYYVKMRYVLALSLVVCILLC